MAEKELKDIEAVEAPKKSKAVDYEEEMRKAEFELRQLEIAEKKANLEDLKERLAEREMKRENRRQRSVTNGTTLRQIQTNDKIAQERCNHHKGGNGQAGIVQGQGDDSQYAVMKHVMPNGDMWVRCLRCGKTWKPPIKESCANDAEYEKLYKEWKDACAFQTRNVTSGSILFGFSDGGAYFRKVMEASTLR